MRPSIKRALTQDSGRDTVICPVISVSDLRRDFQTVNHCRMASKSDRLFILQRIAADPSASAGHDAERNRWQGKALLASENDQACCISAVFSVCQPSGQITPQKLAKSL